MDHLFCIGCVDIPIALVALFEKSSEEIAMVHFAPTLVLFVELGLFGLRARSYMGTRRMRTRARATGNCWAPDP